MEEPKKNKMDIKAQISIALVCVVLGIMLSVQFKTAEEYDYTSYFRSSRVENLTEQLQTVQEEKERLVTDIQDLQTKLTNARNETQAMADLQEELKMAEMVAGKVSVRGPGIILTVNDGQKQLQPGEDPNLLLVHDDDLLRISNELKASGAEAISINNERLIASSEIRCAGTTILVNWKKISPPFVIMATGDPDMLESGLMIKGGYLEAMKYAGLQVHMQKVDQLEIPAYAGQFKFNYSTPVDPEE